MQIRLGHELRIEAYGVGPPPGGSSPPFNIGKFPVVPAGHLRPVTQQIIVVYIQAGSIIYPHRVASSCPEYVIFHHGISATCQEKSMSVATRIDAIMVEAHLLDVHQPYRPVTGRGKKVICDERRRRQGAGPVLRVERILTPCPVADNAIAGD